MKTSLALFCATALTIAATQADPSPSQSTATTTKETTTTAPASTTTTTVTTTTESTGTITEFTPGSFIAISTGTGEPMRYKFGKSVTYVNARGKEINASKLRKDRKVRVHYIKEGNDMIVDKITIVRD